MTALNPGAVLRRFELVSGMSKERESSYITLIMDCIDAFCARLPERDYTDVERRRLTHACAVYAYYRVSMCLEDEHVSSFKAGDISFSRDDDRSGASVMWEAEKAEIGDLVDLGDGFRFKGVRI